MAVEVKWLDTEQTVLVYTFSDPWTWDDYYETTAQGRAMLQGVDHVVVTIIDMSGSRALPPGALTHLRRVSTDRRPNPGPIILVGLNRFVRAMSDMLSRIYPLAAQRVRIVATLDEAYAVLAERQTAENG